MLVAAPAPTAAQSRERTIFASALEKATGQPVDSLAPADVVVREDGVAREVLRVSRVTEPMQLAILVDNSAASAPDVANIRDGLKDFVGALDARHEISLVTYADRPTLVTNVALSREEVVKGIERIFAQSTSGGYLLDAIEETARGFIKRQSPRPVIVVIATEGVEFSNQSDVPVLERLKESGAQLNVLQLVSRGTDDTQEKRYRSIVIDRGTRETGGLRENLLSSMALSDALKGLAADLDHQWRVVYSRPESLIPPRDTTIASARPTLEVRGVLAKEYR